MVRSVQASDSRAALLVRRRTRIQCSRRPEKGVMKLHPRRAFLPFRARAREFVQGCFLRFEDFLAAKLRNPAKRYPEGRSRSTSDFEPLTSGIGAAYSCQRY